MKSIFKGIAILLLLIIVSGAIFLFSFDPNHYKADISQQLSERSGRDVQILGDIQWSLYPWLGFSIGRTDIAQAADFKAEANDFAPVQFAQYRQAQVQVKLLPLLQKRLEIGDIAIEGAMLNLQRHADGTSNWQDFFAAAPALSSKPTASPTTPYRWQLSRLFIKQAEIFWDDQQQGRRVHLQDFNIETGVLDLQQVIDFKASTRLDDEHYFSAELALTSQMRVDVSTGRWILENTLLDLQFRDQALLPQNQHIEWTLPHSQYQAPNFLVNASLLKLNQSPLQIGALEGEYSANEGHVKPVHLNILGINAEFDWRWQAGQAWRSHWLLERFNPRALLSDLKLLPDLPPTLLQALSASFNLEGDDKGVGMYDLSLNIDAHQLEAKKIYWQNDKPQIDVEAALLLKDFPLSVTAEIQNFNEIKGELHSVQFKPQALLDVFGISAPVTHNPNVLKTGSWHSHFYWANGDLQLSEINSQLDQSKLLGLVNINLNQARLQAQLQADTLNISDYLPPVVPAQSLRRDFRFYAVNQSSPTSLLPAWLSQWQTQGQLQIGHFIYQQLQAQALSVDFNSDGQRLLLKPSAQLYQGTLQADVELYTDPKNPRFRANTQLKMIDLDALFSAWTGKKSRIRGLGNISADLSAPLQTVASLQQQLNGLMTVEIQDGALRGVDLLYQIDNVRALLKHAPAPTRSDSKETAFEHLQGHFQLDKQRLHTDDLQTEDKRLNVSAKGDIDLNSLAIDYDINARFSEDKLIGARSINIPVALSGTLDDPKPRVDIKGIINTQDSAWQEKLKQKAKDKLRKWFD